MPSHFIGILSLGPCILFYFFRGSTPPGNRRGYKAFAQQQPSLKLVCCAIVPTLRCAFYVMSCWLVLFAWQRIELLSGGLPSMKGCASGEVSSLLFVVQLRLLLFATWDEPQVLLNQMRGCRLPLANIVETRLGGGNTEGSYGNFTEVFKNTSDGYLANCPCRPGCEVDVLIMSSRTLPWHLCLILVMGRPHASRLVTYSLLGARCLASTPT